MQALIVSLKEVSSPRHGWGRPPFLWEVLIRTCRWYFVLFPGAVVPLKEDQMNSETFRFVFQIYHWDKPCLSQGVWATGSGRGIEWQEANNISLAGLQEEEALNMDGKRVQLVEFFLTLKEAWLRLAGYVPRTHFNSTILFILSSKLTARTRSETSKGWATFITPSKAGVEKPELREGASAHRVSLSRI